MPAPLGDDVPGRLALHGDRGEGGRVPLGGKFVAGRGGRGPVGAAGREPGAVGDELVQVHPEAPGRHLVHQLPDPRLLGGRLGGRPGKGPRCPAAAAPRRSRPVRDRSACAPTPGRCRRPGSGPCPRARARPDAPAGRCGRSGPPGAGGPATARPTGPPGGGRSRRSRVSPTGSTSTVRSPNCTRCPVVPGVDGRAPTVTCTRTDEPAGRREDRRPGPRRALTNCSTMPINSSRAATSGHLAWPGRPGTRTCTARIPSCRARRTWSAFSVMNMTSAKVTSAPALRIARRKVAGSGLCAPTSLDRVTHRAVGSKNGRMPSRPRRASYSIADPRLVVRGRRAARRRTAGPDAARRRVGGSRAGWPSRPDAAAHRSPGCRPDRTGSGAAPPLGSAPVPLAVAGPGQAPWTSVGSSGRT